MSQRANHPSTVLHGAAFLGRLALLALLLLPWGCFSCPTAWGDSGAVDALAPLPAQVRAYRLDPQPLVTLCFDDANQDVYDTAFPILRSQGIPATLFFITSFLDGRWKTQLGDLEDHGWEIGSHGRTHRNLAELSSADLIEELRQSKADLEAAGVEVSGLAYPFGSGYDDTAVLRQVKRHYSYARSVRPGNNAPIIGRYALASEVVTNATSIDTMKSWVDSAVDRKQWLIILLHNVDDSGTDYSISPAEFSDLVSYIKTRAGAGELSAVTVKKGVTQYSQGDWHPIYTPQPTGGSDIVIMNDRLLWQLGSRISDYLYDGYEWVESGELRYYESNGSYRTIGVPSGSTLTSISPDRAIAEVTLSSVDQAASVVSTITLTPESPLAEVRTIRAQGSPQRLLIAKDLTRRFSVDEGLLVGDGALETHLRKYGDGVRSFFAFDGTTDLIRIMTHLRRKSHSEYADYTRGEFRCGTIDVEGDLPFTWAVGGMVFDTSGLFVEAETGEMDGQAAFYAGADASPQTGHTGVTLDNNDTVSVDFTPPVRGDYTLFVRYKSAGAGGQCSVQMDEGEPATQAVIGASFGYGNIFLRDLSAEVHSVKVAAVSGAVDVDYILLVPAGRSAGTPAGVEFPAGVVRQAYDETLLPFVMR